MPFFFSLFAKPPKSRVAFAAGATVSSVGYPPCTEFICICMPWRAGWPIWGSC